MRCTRTVIGSGVRSSGAVALIKEMGELVEVFGMPLTRRFLPSRRL
jgi:hypothetical protein